MTCEVEPQQLGWKQPPRTRRKAAPPQRPSLLQMMSQLILAIETIDTSTIAANDMAVVDVLGSEVLLIVASKIAGALEDAGADVAGVEDGCWGGEGSSWGYDVGDV
jgi:hypothetical protein